MGNAKGVPSWRPLSQVGEEEIEKLSSGVRGEGRDKCVSSRLAPRGVAFRIARVLLPLANHTGRGMECDPYAVVWRM